MGVYLQLVMFCFINLYSLSSMLGSPLHGLKEATKEIEAPIPVLPLQNSERDYTNCWGCRISCKEVIENIELALLRSLVHDDPAYIERYGYKDQLESIVYKFHLCQKSEMGLESDVEVGASGSVRRSSGESGHGSGCEVEVQIEVELGTGTGDEAAGRGLGFGSGS